MGRGCRMHMQGTRNLYGSSAPNCTEQPGSSTAMPAPSCHFSPSQALLVHCRDSSSYNLNSQQPIGRADDLCLTWSAKRQRTDNLGSDPLAHRCFLAIGPEAQQNRPRHRDFSRAPMTVSRVPAAHETLCLTALRPRSPLLVAKIASGKAMSQCI